MAYVPERTDVDLTTPEQRQAVEVASTLAVAVEVSEQQLAVRVEVDQ